MRSETVIIDNQGRGLTEVLEETREMAAACGMLNARNTLRLQLLAEEMLCLARSVTGEMQASFFIEGEGAALVLHMATSTVMDREKRAQLIESATSQKNEAARGFLGKLRDIFEQAMASEGGQTEEVPYDLRYDVPSSHAEDDEWDGYERSILRRLADNVKISIRGGLVEMTVSKDFAG